MSRLLTILLAMLVAVAAGAQTAVPPVRPSLGLTWVDIAAAQSAASQSPSGASAQSGAPASGASAPPLDPARQMQLDLDRMESLVNNMAAQVGFIHDTNMSILLNTNVQLWNVLIRDLRLQLQEQQRANPAPKN